MSDDKNLVKISFQLEPDEDGWPPAGSEGLWAEVLPGSNYTPDGATRYRVDNVPWFVQDLAVDDVITAEPGADGILWAGELVRPGGRITVRLIPYPEGPFKGDPVAAARAFERFSIHCEVLDVGLRMVALDIGPGDDLRGIKTLLDQGKAEQWWGYEEGCVTDAWLQL